jgi:glucose-1-phosphate adenylyltransferase
MVILAGDHIYKMDYELMLPAARQPGRDVTIGCLEVPRMEATGFGVMHVDGKDRITDFVEKPADPPGIPGKPGWRWPRWASMSSRHEVPSNSCAAMPPTRRSSRDFGKDIIPYIVKNGKAVAHRFTTVLRARQGETAYWRDVGTLDAYWEANIDLTEIMPQLDLYDRDWPIWTYAK